MNDEPGSGKLHIDSDWKSEAAEEKERLAREEARAPRRPGPGGEAPPSFIELVNVVAMQAVIALGGMRSAAGEAIPPNPIAARHYIDLLDVLHEKTQGNLSDEEKRTLEAVLYELRMQYVQTVSGTPPPQPPPAQRP